MESIAETKISKKDSPFKGKVTYPVIMPKTVHKRVKAFHTSLPRSAGNLNDTLVTIIEKGLDVIEQK